MQPDTPVILVELSKSWVDYLSALLVPTVAIFGILIAALQWRTNRNRLKHELFDRRWDVFTATREFLASILSAGNLKREAEQDFLIKTKGARFIFDDRIHEYLFDKLWDLAVDLQTLNKELENEPAGETRTANIRRQREIKDSLMAELRGIEKKFAKYMQLTH